MSNILAIKEILTNNDDYRQVKRAIAGEKEAFANLIKFIRYIYIKQLICM